MNIKMNSVNFLHILDSITDGCCPLENEDGLCTCASAKENNFDVCCSEELYNYLKDKNILEEIL